MKSTTAIGDELRDYVVELLEASGHRIIRELGTDTKKIDTVLHMDGEFHPRTIAIECKILKSNLSQKNLVHITEAGPVRGPDGTRICGAGHRDFRSSAQKALSIQRATQRHAPVDR